MRILLQVQHLDPDEVEVGTFRDWHGLFISIDRGPHVDAIHLIHPSM